MAKAKKMSNGKWRLRSFIGTDSKGKKYYQSFTCDTEKECYKEERKWLKAGGGHIIEEKPVSPTVDQTIKDYIESCRNNKRKSYSPRTIKEYESCRKNGFGKLSGREADKITTDDIQDLIDQRTADGRTPKTIINAIYLLKPAMEHAGYEQIKWRTLELPESETKEYIIPTDEQIQALLNATIDSDPALYQSIVLGSFCGCRRSEIAALLYSDVDRKTMTVSITKAIVENEKNEYTQKETKSRAGTREIVIDKSILDALMIRQKKTGVIYAPGTSLVGLNPDVITTRFCVLRDKLGYKFCFHALRHYHASIMCALNVPKMYAAARMGHADFKMIEKVYGQIVEGKERVVSDSVNGHAAVILSGKTYNW